jgi:hypothetical protein
MTTAEGTAAYVPRPACSHLERRQHSSKPPPCAMLPPATPLSLRHCSPCPTLSPSPATRAALALALFAPRRPHARNTATLLCFVAALLFSLSSSPFLSLALSLCSERMGTERQQRHPRPRPLGHVAWPVGKRHLAFGDPHGSDSPSFSPRRHGPQRPRGERSRSTDQLMSSKAGRKARNSIARSTRIDSGSARLGSARLISQTS